VKTRKEEIAKKKKFLHRTESTLCEDIFFEYAEKKMGGRYFQLNLKGQLGWRKRKGWVYLREIKKLEKL